ncbi:MAG: DUF1572 family protein [Bacteroidia bacterium]
MQSNYISSAVQQFRYYKMLGDKTFLQLSEEELFVNPDEISNSIAVMVKHMWGNMMSRWTDFLTTDGEKEFRNRDSEFESDRENREELLSKWEEGWSCLFEALESINEENFDTTVYIRNQGHTIVEAVNRQMMHYAYHVGQIVFLGRAIKGSEWESLSIPKGESKSYNSEKFAQKKSKKHFTDEYLK